MRLKALFALSCGFFLQQPSSRERSFKLFVATPRVLASYLDPLLYTVLPISVLVVTVSTVSVLISSVKLRDTVCANEQI